MISLIDIFKNYKISMSFLLIIILFISFGIITILGLYKLGNLTKTIYEHPLTVSNASLIAALEMTKMHRSMKDVVLADTPGEIEVDAKVVIENEKNVYQQLDIIKKNILGEEGKDLEKQTRELFIAWKPIRDEVFQLLKSGDKKEAILITREKGAEHVKKLESKMLELTKYARAKAAYFIGIVEYSQRNLKEISIFLTLAGVFLSIVISYIAISRILAAEQILLDKNNQLQKVLDEVKTLRGIIPICMYCKKIKSEKNVWNKLEKYISEHSDADFSHGICPDCYKIQMDKLNRNKNANN